jgi:hypothetical protein
LLKLGILIPPAASGAVWLFLNATEPGKPKSNLAATDSCSSTWFGRISMNGELQGSKPDSPCQPEHALLDGYQGSVVGVAHLDRLLP